VRDGYSGLQKMAPVDDVSPSRTSEVQTGIEIPGDGDDQIQYVQPTLDRGRGRGFGIQQVVLDWAFVIFFIAKTRLLQGPEGDHDRDHERNENDHREEEIFFGSHALLHVTTIAEHMIRIAADELRNAA